MWPWAHAALGYLVYTLALRVRADTTPAGWPVIALAVGTQLPDLVDKPLAWYLAVLPYGRTLAHSLLVAVPVSVAVVWLARRRDRPLVGGAFAVGYLAHLFGDALAPIVSGDWADLAFLVWPLLPIPNIDDETEGLVAHLRDLQPEPFFLFGLGLTAAMVVLWNQHGRPGVAELWSLVN